MRRNYIYNIGDKFIDQKRNLLITHRERIIGYTKSNPNVAIKVYTCTCLKCNDTNVKITESHLKEGRGCPTCRGLKVVKGINDIPTTSPWMIPYFQGGKDEASMYTNNSNKKIYPKCPHCGRISEKEIKINRLYTKNGFSCHCSDGISYPEKFVSQFLNQLNIPYISQASKNTFSWLNLNIRYDFYVPSKNLIIEVNGLQHYAYNNWTGKSLKQEQENDNLKKQLALSNGILHYIQLDCRESSKTFIKNSILKSELNSVFNLYNIDWDTCELKALSNRTKEICDYYTNVSHATKKIAKHFQMDHTTIIRHLKIGNKYNWCIPLYNPSDRKVIIYKDNKSNTYESAKFVSINSINILGIKDVSPQYIRFLCRKNKNFHGYTFSYAN